MAKFFPTKGRIVNLTGQLRTDRVEQLLGHYRMHELMSGDILLIQDWATALEDNPTATSVAGVLIRGDAILCEPKELSL